MKLFVRKWTEIDIILTGKQRLINQPIQFNSIQSISNKYYIVQLLPTTFIKLNGFGIFIKIFAE